MKKEEMKNELIHRYKYIYENCKYILLSNVSEKRIYNKLKVVLGGIPDNYLEKLEDFLLGDIPYCETLFYKELEKNKSEKSFLEEINSNLEKVNNYNSNQLFEHDKISLDLNQLLSLLIDYFIKKYRYLNSKNSKIDALGQYFKINNYTNDNEQESFINGYGIEYSLDNSKFGNEFIKYLNDINNLNDNYCVLTEKEIQEIYLAYHNELPWDLTTECSLESSDLFMKRPKQTEPCHERFRVIKDEIFVNPNKKDKSFYQLCPYCGYINNITDSLLSDEIKNEIITKCKNDKFIFRKMMLYSELYNLDKDNVLLIRKK